MSVMNNSWMTHGPSRTVSLVLSIFCPFQGREFLECRIGSPITEILPETEVPKVGLGHQEFEVSRTLSEPLLPYTKFTYKDGGISPLSILYGPLDVKISRSPHKFLVRTLRT